MLKGVLPTSGLRGGVHAPLPEEQAGDEAIINQAESGGASDASRGHATCRWRVGSRHD